MDPLIESPLKINGYVNEPTRNLPQYIAATSANLILMIAGTVLGWTSPVLPQLMSNNTIVMPEPVTIDQSSWIGSLIAIGAVIGPLPAGLCADAIGRKKALLLVAIPFLASWSILTVATSVEYLYVGRVISGFAMGWSMTVLPMYIGEIATPTERGALAVLGQILMTLGFVYVYTIGPFVSYTWICIACSVVPVLFGLSFAWMPESPYYFIEKNDKRSAGSCLQRLRGKSADGVKEELQSIQNSVEESLKNAGSWGDLIRIPGNFKATWIMFGLMALQQCSGINVVLFYSEDIFVKAGSTLSPSICTILVGIVMFVASFGGPYLIEKLGRRMVLIVSAVGMMIAQGVLGLNSLLEALGHDTKQFGWLPLAAIGLYITVYSIGVGPVPWAMIGEMFDTSIRSKGATLTTCFSWFLAFLMTKFFGEVVLNLGAYTAFWMFATSCGLGALFVFLCLPETRGKTLQEIQDILNSRNSKI